MTAVRIASVAYDAAAQCFEALVEYFTPGIAVPLRVPVRVSAPQSLSHHELARGLVRRANHRITR